MPYNCIVWGIGDDYEKIINQLQFEILKGNIRILALVARPRDIIGKILDGVEIITKEELRGISFDWLIITSKLFYKEICNEAKELGIDEDKIINGAVMMLPLFDFNRYVQLIKNKITILSDDCWGGYVYHNLYMQFYSPLVNIYWQKKDFIKFIQKPEYYLKQPLMIEREGNIRGNACPIGSLGTDEEKVCMEFVHSVCFADAESFWDRRKKRINFDNLFIKLGIDATDEYREEYLNAFADVKQKKICFYSGETDIEGVLYLKRFEKYVRTGSTMGTIKYHDCCRNIGWLLKSIDILRLLNGESEFLRE